MLIAAVLTIGWRMWPDCACLWITPKAYTRQVTREARSGRETGEEQRGCHSRAPAGGDGGGGTETTTKRTWDRGLFKNNVLGFPRTHQHELDLNPPASALPRLTVSKDSSQNIRTTCASQCPSEISEDLHMATSTIHPRGAILKRPRVALSILGIFLSISPATLLFPKIQTPHVYRYRMSTSCTLVRSICLYRRWQAYTRRYDSDTTVYLIAMYHLTR